MRLLITLFTLLLFNSCKVVKENDKYGIQFFIKSVYNDSDVVKSGSLLYEPFQVRTNKLPSLIILKLIDSFYSPQNPSEIEHKLPKGFISVDVKELKVDLDKLETEKIIILDSINFKKDSNINYLGYLTILQIFADKKSEKVYIYYLITNQDNEGHSRVLSEINLINGKWQEVKAELIDRY
jgi:hypothetical protein